jgi:pyruvate/2-oxoglutarate dehydrogenase complex dihydrolipoamide dehydrogenase (E3) component
MTAAAPLPVPSMLLDDDPHDARLRANVRPPEWRNPAPADRYHLVVVGGGTAGLVTAAIGAGLGARVALVERHLLGGDCLNSGCVPSKAILRAAHAWAEARGAAERFGGPRVAEGGDFGAAMVRMRRLRADISPADSAARFRDLGVDVFLGEGRFTGEQTLEVGGAVLRFRRAVIATGARPAVPPVPGLAEAGYLTSETVFGLTELPQRLAVVGAGPIGCELAQAFARFGSEVTLLDGAERILGNDDPEAADVVARALVRDGVRLALGAPLQRVVVDGADRVVHAGEGAGAREVRASHVLVAVGRTPNVEGLGLDAAGVEREGGRVRVDGRMCTANPRIYAIGDAASRLQFTHAADAQARMVVRNALFFGRGQAEDLVVPWVTYTTPELAHVGVTAAEVSGRDDVETLTVPYAEVDRARLDGDDEGFLRVHLARGSDRILGGTVVCGRAGDVVSQLAQAMTAGLGLGAVGETVFPYPTEAEALRRAADRWRRGKLTPTARRAFSLFFRVFR